MSNGEKSEKGRRRRLQAQHGVVKGVNGTHLPCAPTEPGRPPDKGDLLQAVVAGAPVVLWALDRNGVFTLSEGKGLQALGLKSGEVVGQSVFDLFRAAPDVAGHARRALTGEAFTCLSEVAGRVYECRYSPLFGPQGELSGAVGVATDITERRQVEDAVRGARDELEARVRERTADLARSNAALHAEAAERRWVESALRVSERRYRYIVETANEGIWLSDGGADTVFVNLRMASMLGYTPQEMVGRSLFAFMDEDQRGTALSKLEQSRAGIAEQYDFRFRRKDGAPAWGMVSASPVLDQEGRYQGALAMITDITARKRAERALRTSEERLRLLAENVSEAVWIEDPGPGRLLYVSPAYEEIYGQSCERLYEDPLAWKEMVHPEDMKWVDAALQKEAHGEPARAEYRIVCPDGATRWVRRRSFPISQEHGGFFVGGVAEDITERRQAETQRIAYAVRQRDTLIREVHHRIKNNLQGVAGLLRNVAGEHPETAPFMDAAIAQIRSIGIVHGLQSRGAKRGLRVGEVLMAIAGAVESLTGAHVVPHVIPEGATPADLAEGEAVAVALILNELIMNAVKHSSVPRAHVSIDLECRPESASVRICNRGRLPSGFDFEAAYGTGIGLELVRSLLPRRGAHLSIARHGREVWALVELTFPTLEPPRSTDGRASGGSNR